MRLYSDSAPMGGLRYRAWLVDLVARFRVAVLGDKNSWLIFDQPGSLSAAQIPIGPVLLAPLSLNESRQSLSYVYYFGLTSLASYLDSDKMIVLLL